MTDEKERAYRYDLLIAPDWRERFDTIIDKHFKLPTEGRILDVNCGTGAEAIELAAAMRGRGEVIGVDTSHERLELARAKALVQNVDNVSFEVSLPYELRWDDDEFDAVICDASMLPADEIEDTLAELLRVAAPDARVLLKIATHGSFDEFFSIYWEALHDAGLDAEVWTRLESLINERLTVSNAELMARRVGLRRVVSYTSREEFTFEASSDFFVSPMIGDTFLADWLEILPENKREEVCEKVAELIDRERNDAPFEVSIKATVIAGVK
jgi:ubiquinone/menaquinone biosynthesis C-methylase UbiE